LAWVVF